MQKNSALLVAMTKGNGGGASSGGGGRGGGSGDGGRSGGGGGGSNKHRDQGTKAICPNCNKLVVHVASNCYMLPAYGQDSYLAQAPQIGLTGTGFPQ
jgi:hypothetical protein